jgi:hypothetical protein
MQQIVVHVDRALDHKSLVEVRERVFAGADRQLPQQHAIVVEAGEQVGQRLGIARRDVQSIDAVLRNRFATSGKVGVVGGV